MDNPTFGVDLITFFHPDFWACPDEAAVMALGRKDPTAFWNRILDELAGSGVAGIELTFAPFDWRTAVAAFGDTTSFLRELSRRDLRVISGFFADVAIGGGLEDAARRATYLDAAEAYAAFLREADCDVMVMGLPMRRSWDATPPLFVDFGLMRSVASFCHELGAATLRRGVRLALHTEAHSIFCTARDVDLLMTMTDPVYVGLCPDTAHLLLSGSDPVAVARRHRDRLIATHWKDAAGRFTLREPIDDTIHHAHRPHFRTLGQGAVDWDAWGALLREIGYEGVSVLEIDAVPDPVGELRRSIAVAAQHLPPEAHIASGR